MDLLGHLFGELKGTRRVTVLAFCGGAPWNERGPTVVQDGLIRTIELN